MSAKTPASLRKALAFRAVELSLRLAPQERPEERIVEQVVLPLKEEIAEVEQFTPQERSPDRIVKDMADIPVPQEMEELVAVVQEVAQFVPQEECATADRRANCGPVYSTKIIEVLKLVPRERAQQRIDQQIVELLIPQILEQIVEVGLAPQARVQRIDEQFVEVPVSQITKDSVEKFKIAPQEQFSEKDL